MADDKRDPLDDYPPMPAWMTEPGEFIRVATEARRGSTLLALEERRSRPDIVDLRNALVDEATRMRMIAEDTAVRFAAVMFYCEDPQSNAALRDFHHEVKDTLFDEQRGACAICKHDFSDYRAEMDHDHDTGMVRGVLCAKCNLACRRIPFARETNATVLYAARPPARGRWFYVDGWGRAHPPERRDIRTIAAWCDAAARYAVEQMRD